MFIKQKLLLYFLRDIWGDQDLEIYLSQYFQKFCKKHLLY